jgi:hypothetical protein
MFVFAAESKKNPTYYCGFFLDGLHRLQRYGQKRVEGKGVFNSCCARIWLVSRIGLDWFFWIWIGFGLFSGFGLDLVGFQDWVDLVFFGFGLDLVFFGLGLDLVFFGLVWIWLS